MKAIIFEAGLVIQHTVTRELKAVREEVFYLAFNLLTERCKHCAKMGRDHIE